MQVAVSSKPTYQQWRRNEFESGRRAHIRRRAPENFSVVSLHFSGFTNTISRFVERFLVHFGQFLVCISSTHGAPCQSYCKSGRPRAPRIPYAVGATAYQSSLDTIAVKLYAQLKLKTEITVNFSQNKTIKQP